MVIIANVGDSRTYIGRGRDLEQITSDHSLVAWLVRQNQLAPDDVQNHPYRNVIMHALGTPEPPQIDIFVRELDGKDYLLLCSDGIWDSLSDAELASFLNTDGTLAEAMAEIMAAAQDHRDDLALIIARFANNQSEPTA
jgi:protein phosphatase